MNDNHPHYARIGFALMLGAALVTLVLMWFGGLGANDGELEIETFFRKPVSGLTVGSTVTFRGVKVGRVSRMSFAGAVYRNVRQEDLQTIWVLLSLDRRQLQLDKDESAESLVRDMIRRGLHATVSSSVLTGIAQVELDYPSAAIADVPPSWQPRHLCIPPAPTFLESAADLLPRVLDRIGQIDFAEAWTNVVGVIGAANGTLGGANALIESQQGNVSEIIVNLREASASLRDFADQLKANPGLILRNTNPEPLKETSL